jgi:hypothetical protein
LKTSLPTKTPAILPYTGGAGVVSITGFTELFTVAQPIGCGNIDSCVLKTSSDGALSTTQNTFLSINANTPFAVTLNKNVVTGYDDSFKIVCASS